MISLYKILSITPSLKDRLKAFFFKYGIMVESHQTWINMTWYKCSMLTMNNTTKLGHSITVNLTQFFKDNFKTGIFSLCALNAILINIITLHIQFKYQYIYVLWCTGKINYKIFINLRVWMSKLLSLIHRDFYNFSISIFQYHNNL